MANGLAFTILTFHDSPQVWQTQQRGCYSKEYLFLSILDQRILGFKTKKMVTTKSCLRGAHNTIKWFFT